MSEIENVNVEKEEKEVVSRNFIEQIIDKDLAEGVLRLLTDDGLFAVILPTAESELLLSAVRGRLFPWRRCEVWSTPESGARRIMLELHKEPPQDLATREKIVIEEGGRHVYSQEYKALTADFYLNF